MTCLVLATARLFCSTLCVRQSCLHCSSALLVSNTYLSAGSTLVDCTGSRHEPWVTSARGVATTADKLTLKSALRQLYKRVHPDLFVDYPAEQAENERSFKLLQDYLHQARSPTVGPASRVAYHFRFFLTPQHDAAAASSWTASDDDEEEDDQGDTPGAPGPDSPRFELVQLVLVPPPPPPRSTRPPPSSSSSGSGSGSQPLSAGAKQGLLKLLRMCGFEGVLPLEEGEEEAPPATAHLTTFLPEAAEVVRQHESGPAKHEVRVANMRAAFRLARGVIAGFQPGAFTGAQQIEHLQRLADAFDLLSDEPPDLSGLHILICSRTALDTQGNLCLDASAGVEDWAAFLGGVDPDYALEKKASAAALRALEGRVAAAVGVRMLFTSAPYLMTHEYRSFLERMAAHAADHGAVNVDSPVGGGGSSSSSSTAGPSTPGTNQDGAAAGPNVTASSLIPVYVSPAYQLPEQQQQQQVVHESVGYIQVPMQASAQEVYNIIQANAPAALSILSQKAADQSELAELTTSVRTRLGLRRLIKDELISMQEFRNACNRLLINRDALQQCHIDGLSIRVSDKNRVAPDGSLVDIAWDFAM